MLSKIRPRELVIPIRRSVSILALAMLGCRPAGSQGLPDAAQRARTGAHARIVAVSAPEVEFAAISGVGADSRGRIFVADWMQKRVTVLSPDGEMLRTLGAVGSGPGEYRAIRGMQVIQGDTVLVYDPELARVTAYEPDSLRVAGTTNLAGRLHGAAPFRVWRAGVGYAAVFRSGFQFSGGTVATRRDSVTEIGGDGGHVATLAHVPPRGFLISGNSVTPNPFGREPLVATDSRGRIHYLWSDSLAVRTYDVAGRSIGSFAVPWQPPRVTRADVDRELAAMDDYGRRTFGQALSDSMPATWPAVRDLLVDDEDRLWIGLGGTRGAAREWAVFTPEGRYLRSVMVPEPVTLRAIRRGRLYGDQVNDDGVPSIVMLTLDREVK